MSDYFAAHPDHAILVGILGFFALSLLFGRGRRSRRRGSRSAEEYYQRMLRGGWRDDG